MMQLNKKHSIRFIWLMVCLCMFSIHVQAQCNADAGSITADVSTVCLEASSIDISAIAGGDAFIPTGYSLSYLLSFGAEQVILELQPSPVFNVSDPGVYGIHPFIYEATFDFTAIIAGVTTVGEIAALFDPAGGSGDCGAVNLTGASVVVQPSVVCTCVVAGGSTVISGTTLTLTTICAGDGIPDPIDVTVTGQSGTNFQWVITDANGNILGLPAAPPFDLEGAGEGVCLIWNLAYEDGLTGAVVGNNANTDLEGCYDLSNPITVTRNGVNGGEIDGMSGTIYNRAVIANRASGTISVINSDDNTIEGTYDMPDNGEPMYVVYNQSNNTVLVGDYTGKVAAFNGETFATVGSANAGAGVFHMWLSPDNQQLWVNNELDKTISVINPNDLSTITTFSIPSDLLVVGYKPHDVIVSPDNSAAFVTMLGGAGGYVIKYSTTTFTETARAFVGDDPHVSLTGANDKLYVASQGSGELAVLNRSDLSEVTVLNVPNAHGLGMNKAGTYLYVGNIADGGTAATYTIDLATNTLVGNPVDAPFAAPHNYSVTGDDAHLFLTHSGGANDKVSVYTLSPTPTLVTSLTVGNNPFGLVTYTYGESFTETTICAGDGVPDPIEVNLSGNYGNNSQWVITDAAGNILGLPAAPPFDLEGAGVGVCLIWHLSYEDGLTGAVVGNNAITDLVGCYDLSNPITVTREDCGGCDDENTLCFDDAGVDWTMNALSGTFTVGTQTFDVSIEDTDNILLATTEVGDALQVRIDPYDNNDVVNITYALSEVADNVVFPIADLDKKSSGSNQEEQVCVYGYLGANPTPIEPVITSLNGSVDINGSCATATTDSAISGEDESVLVTFDQCIDRVVIVYGSGPMAPDYPAESKIEIGEGACFLTQVCGPCQNDCTENVLDFTNTGVEWNSGTSGGNYQVGLQNYNIAISDTDNILVNTEEDGAGLLIGIEPNSNDDEVTVCYNLSEISNNVYFKIRDLDKKESSSMQQEQVCVYGLLGDSPVQIMPTISSYDGSVDINGNCATATTNSAISGQEESVIVNFSDCIDKIVIVYGSGPMAPADPSYSKIYIGDEFGIVTGECGGGSGTICENDCIAQNVLDFNNSGIDWADEALAGNYTVGSQTYDISVTDPDNILETEVDPFSIESGSGIQIGINPGDADDVVTICYDLSEISNDVFFKIEDLDKKSGASDQQEEVCVLGSLDGTAVTPIITSYDGNVAISGNCATATTGSSISGQEESVLVRFDQCIDQICIEYGSGDMAPADPTYSKITIGGEFGFYTGVCGDGCDTCDSGDPGTLTASSPSLCVDPGASSPTTITATPNGDAVIPAGYSVTYLLVSNAVILQMNMTEPSFDVTDAGDYTLHGFVYDAAAFDLSQIVLGSTTAGELNALLTQGGGDACASLDLLGASVSLADPDQGSLSPDPVSACDDSSGDPVTLSATHGVEPVVPNGYVALYLLVTPPLANPPVIQTSLSPSFDVTDADSYTIHTLVYNPASGLDLSSNSLLNIFTQTIDAGGTICAKLDIAGASFAIPTCLDNDDDGIPDNIDLDDDNDGIADIEEAGGIDPSADADDDGTPNYADTDYPGFADINGDGINDLFDFDGDSVPDIFDLDSDNDGVTDLAETGGTDADADGNGLVDTFIDADNDGWTDIHDNDDNNTPAPNDGSGTPLANADSDGDGLADAVDLDSDNDGVTDITEAGGQDDNGDGIVDNLADADGDGLADIVDPDDNSLVGGNDGPGIPLPDADIDGDGINNRIDLDSDNDGIVDLVEAGGEDNNGDGRADNAVDSDNDGYVNIFDASNGGTALGIPDTDRDGNADFLDLDSDNDGLADISEVTGGMDADRDGAIDNFSDLDNDGLADAVDTENDNTPAVGDGIGVAYIILDNDNDGNSDHLDLDKDNDGVPDIIEAGGEDNDGDGTVDNPLDSDNDGYADIVDPNDNDTPGPGDGPGTALENPDSDRDGFADALDLDADNDGIPDIIEAGGQDGDRDGQVDNLTDSDNDGYANVVDPDDNNTPGAGDGPGTALPVSDFDGDSTRDMIDLDSDNDGVPDLVEAGGEDSNRDGTIDMPMDSDNDGYADIVDPNDNDSLGAGDGPGTPLDDFDTDGDNNLNRLDLDSDNDGVTDLVEAGGSEVNGDGVIDNFIDNDNDGYAELVDPDNNNTPAANDGPGTPLADSDTDSDGLNDRLDLDSDNDEIPDIAEVGLADADGDGRVDDATDTDNDGYADMVDPTDGGTPAPAQDTDGDLILDRVDLDSDNDGIADIIEAGGADMDRNGLTDAAADVDNDGLFDSVDPDNNNTPAANDGLGTPLYTFDGATYAANIDKDQDGYPNHLDLDSDNDGLSDLAESLGDMEAYAMIDVDYTGTLDGADNDKDGIIDGTYDNGAGHGGSNMIAPLNTDTDSFFDFLDIDADNDGITDLTEGQPTIGFIAPSLNNLDIDGDGINDAFDMNIGSFGGFLFIAVDTELDGIPDYLDLNSDNDAEPDAIEGFDFNGDGDPETLLANGDNDEDGLDDGFDADPNAADPTNGNFFPDVHPDIDGGETERDWRDPLNCISVEMNVLLEGALVDPTNPGVNYLNTMRPNLNVDRGLLPGQTPVNQLVTATPAGQPYNVAPWNYVGDEGFDWTDAEYIAYGVEYGQQVVDWISVSFRTSTAADTEIARTAALVMEDGTVVFVEDCYLPALGDNSLYIVAEHRNHMGAMSQSAVPVVGGRMNFDFRIAESYVGANPANPLGVGQKEITPGVFALYGADSEQAEDAEVAVNPSYNITGADKLLWDVDNGAFDTYNAADFDMDGDVRGTDKIIYTNFNNGLFSVVPR